MDNETERVINKMCDLIEKVVIQFETMSDRINSVNNKLEYEINGIKGDIKILDGRIKNGYVNDVGVRK